MDEKFKQQLTVLLVDKAVLGVLLLVVGFWLNWMLERTKRDLGLDAKRSELAAQSQIRFKEMQLAEFYGPVYASLKQIRPLDDLWTSERISGPGKQKILSVVRAANDRIVNILITRSHLIRGAAIPESHARFLTHVAVWHAYQDDPQANWKEFEQIREAHYDMEFEREVFQETEQLKKELAELYTRYGIPADRRAGS
jgi:hypothetical protein